MLGAAALILPASAGAAVLLTQLPGAEGCISAGGEMGCAVGRATEFASGPPVVSPDGRNVYLLATDPGRGVYSQNAIDVFERDPATGALTQAPGTAGCVSGGGSAGCADDVALRQVRTIAISPDGANVYAAVARGVLVFARDRGTGALSPLPGADGCIGRRVGGSPCAPARGLDGAARLAFSPDGAELYVTNFFRPTVATLRRDPVDGGLIQAGLLRHVCPPTACGTPEFSIGTGDLVASADDRNVYVTMAGGVPSVQILTRTAAGALRRRGGRAGCFWARGAGGCRRGRGVRTVTSGLALSPDGRSLYVNSGTRESFGAGGSVAIFRRRGDGTLSQPRGESGCLAVAVPGCAKVPSLAQALAVTVSPDGSTVYVGALGGLTSLTRRRSGLLTPVSGPAGCISASRHGCMSGRIRAPVGLAVSPDGADLYVADAEPGGIATFAARSGGLFRAGEESGRER